MKVVIDAIRIDLDAGELDRAGVIGQAPGKDLEQRRGGFEVFTTHIEDAQRRRSGGKRGEVTLSKDLVEHIGEEKDGHNRRIGKVRAKLV